MLKHFLWLLALSLAFLLMGCSETEDSFSQSDQKALKEISVMLDWYPNALHSFLYVAEEKGYFKEEELAVQLLFPANTTDPLNLAAAGRVTLGFYYQPDVIMARANENIPVKSVATIVHAPLNYLVFLTENNITSPKDLIGKRIGYPGIPINEALMTTMMHHVGENPDQISLIDVGFELGSALVTKNVDAIFGAFINHEVPVLRDQGFEVSYLNPVDFGVPKYSEVVVVTSDSTWVNEQETIEAFWRAAQKGFDYTAKNPQEALAILLAHQDKANFPLKENIEEESLATLLPKMAVGNDFRDQSEASWLETAAWLKKMGLIHTMPDINTLIAK